MRVLANSFSLCPAIYTLRALIPEQGFSIYGLNENGILGKVQKSRLFAQYARLHVQFFIRGAHLLRCGHLQDVRNDARQKNCSWHGGKGRDDLHSAGNPIRRRPKRHHFHQMRCPTGGDEASKANKHPVERNALLLPDQIEQGWRNREIRHRDERVRQDMKPYKHWVPQIAETMRKQTFGTQESLERIHSIPFVPQQLFVRVTSSRVIPQGR